MTSMVTEIGAVIATTSRHSARTRAARRQSPPGLKTLGDLMQILDQDPPANLKRLRSILPLLTEYLGTPWEAVSIDTLSEKSVRSGFRPFLVRDGMVENTVRTYVDHLREFLDHAKDLGWSPSLSSSTRPTLSQTWRQVIDLAEKSKCVNIALDLATTHDEPGFITGHDLDSWVTQQVKQGRSYFVARRNKFDFLEILFALGCAGSDLPPDQRNDFRYSVPLKDFPPAIGTRIRSMLDWRTAETASNRPTEVEIREVTAGNIKGGFEELYGFLINIVPKLMASCDPCNLKDKERLVRLEALSRLKVEALEDIVQESIVGEYVDWCKDRHIRGNSLNRFVATLSAAMRRDPNYSGADYGWFANIMKKIPKVTKEDLLERKTAKLLDYDDVAAIPSKIHADRVIADRHLRSARMALAEIDGKDVTPTTRRQKELAVKRAERRVAVLVRDELLMTWLLVLPWRQRNMRECRIYPGCKHGPNLFKEPIANHILIDTPIWAQEEEANTKGKKAEFWQVHFWPDETKTGGETGRHIRLVLPRRLVALLEEYIQLHRKHLLKKSNPSTLFVSEVGRPIPENKMNLLVSTLTLRYADKRVTPHLFRDIFAFAWLKENRRDYLGTL